MKCRWCDDDITCLDWAERRPRDPLPDWHKDACCSCAQYIREHQLLQMELA